MNVHGQTAPHLEYFLWKLYIAFFNQYTCRFSFLRLLTSNAQALEAARYRVGVIPKVALNIRLKCA